MGSRTEQNFCNYFLLNLPNAWEDISGNIHVIVEHADGSWPMVVWASHTDTVHREEGYQKIKYAKGIVQLDDPTSNCLGADCTIGVWIMREMIYAGVPGHYIFHWGEEKGCIGSGHLVKINPKIVKNAKCVISLDRRGSDEIITFQRGMRTASDAFANSVASMLPKGYKPSDKGIYTDSAEYAEIVPECTNIGVGYTNEHHTDEKADLGVALKLVNAIIRDWDERNLVIERDPKKKEPKVYTHHKGGNSYFQQYPSVYKPAPHGQLILPGPNAVDDEKLSPEEQRLLDKWLREEEEKQEEADKKRIEALQQNWDESEWVH